MKNKLNMSVEKVLVLKSSVELSLEDLFGGFEGQPSKSCEDVASLVLNLKNKYQVDESKGEVSNFCVERDWDGMQCLYFETYRPETDAEFNKRMVAVARQKERSQLAREKKKQAALLAKEQKVAAERAEFERLKQKFGE